MLDALPVRPALRLVKRAVGLAAAVEGALPVSLPDLGRWVPRQRLAARRSGYLA
jgi:hypothetical protein